MSKKMKAASYESKGRKPWRLNLACVAIAAMAFGFISEAEAQFRGGRGFGGIDPEKQAAAWEWEAKSVASSLDLSDEATGKLAAAYKATRESRNEAIQDLFSGGGGGDRSSRRQAFQDLAVAERGKLETAIKDFLSEKQTSKALESLGTFDTQWDRMTDTLVGFKLEEENLNKALGLVLGYVVKSNAERAKVRESGGDFREMREATIEMRESLDTDLAAILSEEQAKEWKEATAGFGGRGRRGGDRQRGQGGRQRQGSGRGNK